MYLSCDLRNDIIVVNPGVNQITMKVQKAGEILILLKEGDRLVPVDLDWDKHIWYVEEGKKAAANTLKLKDQLMAFFKENTDKAFTAEEIAQILDNKEQTEILFKILEHLAHNPEKRIAKSEEIPFYKSTYTFNKI